MPDRSAHGDTLLLDLIVAGRHVLARTVRVLSDAGWDISHAEVLILLHVYAREGLTLSHLATRLARDKTTLARQIASLEKRGYLTRRRDPLDGRRRQLSVDTGALPAADLAFQVARRDVDDVLRENKSILDAADVEAFLRLLVDR